MNLREMIGQRMVSGFPGPEMSEEFIRAVKEYKLGNVILFQHNVRSAAQLKALCADIQALVKRETGHPAFITIDQEGGIVTRFPQDAVTVPGAMSLAAAGDPENAEEAARITADQLRALGVNFNLAPVLDVNSNRRNPVIGARSFGDDPHRVAQFGAAEVRGMTAGGVLSCAKHFPGHGDTAVDSHIGLPCIDKSLEELEQCELIPFKAAIEAGIPAVMTTHILFPQIEKNNVPATMSRTIMTGLLREKLSFRGLIISDCMMMKAIAEHYGTVNGVVAAMQAGVDLVFVCHDPNLCCEAMRAVEAAVRNGTINSAEMEESAAHIVRVKGEMPPVLDVPVGTAAQRQAVRRMLRASVTSVSGTIPELGACPAFFGSSSFASTQASNPNASCDAFPVYMRKHIGGDAFVTPANPDDADIARAVGQAKHHSAIVVSVVSALQRAGQMKLVKALSALQLPMVCVSLRVPYELSEMPQNICCLAAYEYDTESLDAVRAVLTGERIPTGVLPVRI